MVFDTSLKLLSKKIFELTRREIWLGGKSVNMYRTERRFCSDNWPIELEDIFDTGGIYWTLSPVVVLHKLSLRVCVTSVNSMYHHVYVFVDNQLKHPGGHYSVNEFPLFFWNWNSWSGRIAAQERFDGGKTGPVDVRDLLLTEADTKLAEIGALTLTDTEALRIKK